MATGVSTIPGFTGPGVTATLPGTGIPGTTIPGTMDLISITPSTAFTAPGTAITTMIPGTGTASIPAIMQGTTGQAPSGRTAATPPIWVTG